MPSGICNERAMSYLGFFVLGAGIGTGLALLFAPKSGRDTRRYIARRAEDGKDYVSSKSRDMLQQAEDAVGRGKTWASKFTQ